MKKNDRNKICRRKLKQGRINKKQIKIQKKNKKNTVSETKFMHIAVFV